MNEGMSERVSECMNAVRVRVAGPRWTREGDASCSACRCVTCSRERTT